MNYILDGILCATVVFCVGISAKRGFIKSVRNIISLILTVIIMLSVQPMILTYLQSSPISDAVKTTVAKNITKTYEKEGLAEDTDTSDTEASLFICEKLGLPSFLSDGIEKSIKSMSEVKNNVFEVVTDTLTLTVLKILALIMVFLAVKVFVFLAVKILESLFGLPGLKTINGVMGACVGIVNAMVVVYVLCGAAALLMPTDKLSALNDIVNSTHVVKYFYDNNLLLSMFI